MSTAGGTFSLDMKTSAASGRIFAGYNVHEQVALELGFLKTQNMRSNFTGTESHQISFSGSGTRKLSGIDYSVLLRPSQESGMHRFYGRLGGSYLQDDRSATVHAGTHSSYSVRASEKGTGWLAGIGYEHPVSSNLSIRAEYSHYGRIAGDSDTRAGMYGINLIGRF